MQIRNIMPLFVNVLGAIGAVLQPDRKTRVTKVLYKKGSIGTESRFPRNDSSRMQLAAYKRNCRCERNLVHWTGVRHDTVHTPSTVVKLEPWLHRLGY